jgi:hypothetical protein
MSSIFDQTPEEEAEFDAYVAKLAESTTTLEVTPDEFLDYLKTLTTDELMDLRYDRAFRQWKQVLQNTEDSKHIGLTIAFMTAKPNLKSLEASIRVLEAVFRNPYLPPESLDVLIKLSAALKLGYEEWIAESPNITEAQATRLAEMRDRWVWQCLAHNKDLPDSALEAIAHSAINDSAPKTESRTEREARVEQIAKIKAEILIHPNCTPEIRSLINPDAELLALAAQRKADAQAERDLDLDFEESYDDDLDEEYQGV